MSCPLISRYRLPLQITSWAAFAVALTFYWITTDTDVSYWDCPEYVTLASLMEVGHPPGNPVWMLTMRVATMFFPRPLHAYVVNLCSGLLMAFGVFFLCRIIFIGAISLLLKTKSFKYSRGVSAKIMASSVAFGASMCFALCDSVWYSAVEAEVYSMSVFLSVLALWIMVKYWMENSRSRQLRLLILTAYLTGLSLGVHQLNLLLIPVFAFIVLFKNYKRVNFFQAFGCLLGSVCGVALILMGMLPLLLQGAGYMELKAVNNLNLDYNTGVIIFCCLVAAVLIFLLGFLHLRTGSGKNKVFLYGEVAVWMVAFVILGFSSFGMVMIRSQAYPAMNEGKPDNIFALASYIARDQYPSSPLLYGATPYSKPLLQEDTAGGVYNYSRYVLKKGKPQFMQVYPGARVENRSGFISRTDSINNVKVLEKGKGYLLKDYHFTHELTPELNIWLPRITSQRNADIDAYEGWAGMTKENMEPVEVSEARDVAGNLTLRKDKPSGTPPPVSYRPTYWQNLKFFISYQAYYMYFRYLFWNFIGRQNDEPATGEIEHGNFITGIPPLDYYLGTTSEMPPEISIENKGRNRYFAIPFLFGLVGIAFLASKNRLSRRYLFLVTLLFVMTGLAIVAYLNQTPGEPRERDYTFLISYMAFAMWIAAGFLAVGYFFIKFKHRLPAILACLCISLGTPALMAVENFDDHDRRGRYETTYYASSLLDFPYPAYIFSHGDNSTFPLWYASEVLDMGPQHTPLDVTYLATPDYISNLKRQTKRGVKFFSDSYPVDLNGYVFTKIPADSSSSPMPLETAMHHIFTSTSQSPEFPTSIVSVPASAGDSIYINLHDFSRGSRYLSFRHLMLLDILAGSISCDSAKLLYFPYITERSFYKPLEPALQPAIFGYIYAPQLDDAGKGEVLRNSTLRELEKLEKTDMKAHYADPLIASRTARYRGELILAAMQLLEKGEPEMAVRIADVVAQKLPYSQTLPSSFTLGDTTFYEGKAYRRLLLSLHEAVGEERFKTSAVAMDSLLENRRQQWLRYYYSLSPSQRRALSNRSKRLLL